MSKTYLKVKIKSLAAEAEIIKKEERKARDEVVKRELIVHRRRDVAKEARAAHLAYGFLNGKKYAELEPSTPLLEYRTWRGIPISRHYFNKDHIFSRIGRLIFKYGKDIPSNQDVIGHENKLRAQILSDWLSGVSS
mgnify:CR=1 FL=1